MYGWRGFIFGVLGGAVRALSAAAEAIAGHKRALLVGGSAALLAGAGLAVWGVRAGGAPAPPPEPGAQSPRQVREYLASKDFAAQPVRARRDYLERALASGTSGGRGRRLFRGADDLTEEQRHRLRENVGPLMRERMQQMMERRLDDYFALPPAERTAYLDRMIDEMADRRARRPPPTARSRPEPSSESPRPPRRRGRGFAPERMKRHIEKTPPEVRARRMEFHKAMRKRMEERGIRFQPRRRHGRRPRGDRS